MKKITLFIVLAMSVNAFSQDAIIPLWPKDKTPNAVASDEKEVHERKDILRISKVQEPTIEVYLPSKKNATGQAMLIFPGGGYHILAYDWEGTDVAKFLNSKGIAGIVVKYRLPSSVSQTKQEDVPLIDAQRALRLVRSKAETFHIDPNKIGAMGFSAGGHLASTLGTHFEEKVYAPIDAIDALSARPDFLALCYPVITFDQSSTHKGSQFNLLTKNPNPGALERFSNEKQVTANTPPTFLLHATDDKAVPVENSLAFYKALVENDVPATLHIYPTGGHGFSLGLKDPYLRTWTDNLCEWVRSLE
ncbi:alpha/beta hydrolase [Zobellia galactanivorans]|uniref:Pectin acetylesterase, family CE10 n=1 Tax=Zobellia galactanivorans (strain DSM 12802 / CCUG 47099 / CIP 106680 / NCIMB 13871 / Dsij) TaxID=63186 RepID=G0L7C9_ZOBGA|nr:alpha/beta hydrolase [Zobellia galactanivorans]CAZ97321.1 Pectin acetylesterase, family CE10 [Zobellia galactanivorans]